MKKCRSCYQPFDGEGWFPPFKLVPVHVRVCEEPGVKAWLEKVEALVRERVAFCNEDCHARWAADIFIGEWNQPDPPEEIYGRSPYELPPGLSNKPGAVNYIPAREFALPLGELERLKKKRDPTP